nr:MAG TPA: tachykinin family protein [Caudoviricetes sp.]
MDKSSSVKPYFTVLPARFYGIMCASGKQNR